MGRFVDKIFIRGNSSSSSPSLSPPPSPSIVMDSVAHQTPTGLRLRPCRKQKLQVKSTTLLQNLLETTSRNYNLRQKRVFYGRNPIAQSLPRWRSSGSNWLDRATESLQALQGNFFAGSEKSSRTKQVDWAVRSSTPLAVPEYTTRPGKNTCICHTFSRSLHRIFPWEVRRRQGKARRRRNTNRPPSQSFSTHRWPMAFNLPSW